MEILIIEDHKDLAHVIAEQLDNHSCTLLHHGKEASELLAKRSFDLIITDISFPGGGGERILQEMSVRSTPIFVFSSCHQSEYGKLRELGALEIFTKNQLNDLKAAVELLNRFNEGAA